MSEIPGPSESETSSVPPSPEKPQPSHVDVMAAILRSEFQSRPDDAAPIHITMFYTDHGTAADIGGYAKELEKNDCVILEAFGWTRESNLQRKQVIEDRQSIRAEQISWAPAIIYNAKKQSGHAGAQLEALQGTFKTLIMVDVPEGHPLTVRQNAVSEKLNELKWPNPSISFDAAIDRLDSCITENATIQAEREVYMIKQLVPEISKNTQGNRPINILWSIGAAHTAIYHALQKGAEGTKDRVFSQGKPVIYGHFVEAIRDRFFGMQPDRELLARVWMDGVLAHGFPQEVDKAKKQGIDEERQSERSDLWERYFRKISDQFSEDEIRATYGSLVEAGEGGYSEIIVNLVQAKGINFPPANQAEALASLGLPSE